MKPWLGVAVTVLLAVQSATFAYVVRVEQRLTRLETLAELARYVEPRGGPLAPVVPASR